MLANTDITLYTRKYDAEKGEDTWKRTCVCGCWWNSINKTAILESGLKNSNEVSCRIPLMDILISKNDVVVKGNVDIEVESAKSFRPFEHFLITSVKYNTFGINKHIRLGGVYGNI